MSILYCAYRSIAISKKIAPWCAGISFSVQTFLPHSPLLVGTFFASVLIIATAETIKAHLHVKLENAARNAILDEPCIYLDDEEGADLI